MSTLRRVQPIALEEGFEPRDLGPRPELVWVAPTDLWVDETYQRDVSARSLRQLRKTVKNFAWNRMKPPIGVRVDGGIHLIDGQHTAIAAASRSIPEIPVFVVAADELQERARSFVSHNTEHVKVAPLAVYRALLAAKDPDAVTCQAVIDKAGVTFRQINQVTETRIGDTGAFGAVQALVKDQGPMRSRIVLETLVKAECAPINGHQIKAANYMLWIADIRVSPEELWPVILAEGEEGLQTAQVIARRQRTQVWRVLIDRWTQRIHGREKTRTKEIA